MSLVPQWTDRIPLVPLSCPLSPCWPSSLVLLSSCLPSPTPHASKSCKRKREQGGSPRCSTFAFAGRSDLERIAFVPFCARRAYDSFSALSSKLRSVAALSIIFAKTASLPEARGWEAGGGNPSCQELFILINLNDALLPCYLKSSMQLVKLDTP